MGSGSGRHVRLESIVHELRARGQPLEIAEARNVPFNWDGQPSSVFGRFFEYVTRRVYGGEHVGEFASAGADVVNEATQTRYESKAVQNGHSSTLITHQFHSAEQFLKGAPDWRFQFVFYRHGLEAVKDGRPLAEKLTIATAKPIYAVCVPLHFIRSLLDARDRIGGSNFFPSHGYKAAYSLDSSTLHLLAADPLPFLASAGVQAQVSYGNTPRMRIEGYTVPSFPLVELAPRELP